MTDTSSSAGKNHWLATFLDPEQLDDEGWRLIEKDASLITADKGTEMFRAGDPCHHFVIVLQGSIRVQYLDPNGNEIVLYRVQQGETCILTTSCLLGHAQYPAQGLVEVPLQAALIPMAVFQRALAFESVRNYVFSTMGKRIVDLMLLVDEVAFRRMDGRLAQFLLKQGTVLHATHQEIAVELGSAREVISRLLKDFERKGWVAMKRRHIEILAPDALKKLGCD